MALEPTYSTFLPMAICRGWITPWANNSILIPGKPLSLPTSTGGRYFTVTVCSSPSACLKATMRGVFNGM
ncbi:hypothetical protein D3C80_1836550 [compost metagenome]